MAKERFWFDMTSVSPQPDCRLVLLSYILNVRGCFVQILPELNLFFPKAKAPNNEGRVLENEASHPATLLSLD